MSRPKDEPELQKRCHEIESEGKVMAAEENANMGKFCFSLLSLVAFAAVGVACLTNAS